MNIRIQPETRKAEYQVNNAAKLKKACAMGLISSLALTGCFEDPTATSEDLVAEASSSSSSAEPLSGGVAWSSSSSITPVLLKQDTMTSVQVTVHADPAPVGGVVSRLNPIAYVVPSSSSEEVSSSSAAEKPIVIVANPNLTEPFHTCGMVACPPESSSSAQSSSSSVATSSSSATEVVITPVENPPLAGSIIPYASSSSGQ